MFAVCPSLLADGKVATDWVQLSMPQDVTLEAIKSALQHGDYAMNNYKTRTSKINPAMCVRYCRCTCEGCQFKGKAVHDTGGDAGPGMVTVWAGGEHTGNHTREHKRWRVKGPDGAGAAGQFLSDSVVHDPTTVVRSMRLLAILYTMLVQQSRSP